MFGSKPLDLAYMTCLFLALVCGLHSPNGAAAPSNEYAAAVQPANDACAIDRLPVGSSDRERRATPDCGDPESGCNEEEKYTGSPHASLHAIVDYQATVTFQLAPECVSTQLNSPRLILSTQLRC